MSKEKNNETKDENKTNAKLIAKRDFKIVHNEYCREIKTGDDLSDIPEIYLPNLKTEKVL